jgi:hypothetical protein
MYSYFKKHIFHLLPNQPTPLSIYSMMFLRNIRKTLVAAPAVKDANELRRLLQSSTLLSKYVALLFNMIHTNCTPQKCSGF